MASGYESELVAGHLWGSSSFRRQQPWSITDIDTKYRKNAKYRQLA